jgi:diaminopimelate epimerase
VTLLHLVKYHGLGNDFLVLLDGDAVGDGAATLARHLCDRHRGVGADGLIIARRAAGAADVAMELRNADGGRAETSGNGLRCFALALVDSGTVEGPLVTIETDGGLVTAVIRGPQGGRDGCALVEVTMGTALVGAPEPAPPSLGEGFEARRVGVGNPHLVLIGDSLDGVDITAIGPPLEVEAPEGQNVEVVALGADGGLDLVVWERGAGATQACGSGSCAAAAAARASGLVGDRVTVRNPGGVLSVGLSGDLTSPEVTLEGPACRIAAVEVEFELERPPGGETVP